jgi:hypothetical protein
MNYLYARAFGAVSTRFLYSMVELLTNEESIEQIHGGLMTTRLNLMTPSDPVPKCYARSINPLWLMYFALISLESLAPEHILRSF